MKIAITGHTSGIGKALHEVCKNVTDDFLLMSRSTGYNLKTSIEQIKKDIIDYDPDIIFNNAWYPWFTNCIAKKIFTNYLKMKTSTS